MPKRTRTKNADDHAVLHLAAEHERLKIAHRELTEHVIKLTAAMQETYGILRAGGPTDNRARVTNAAKHIADALQANGTFVQIVGKYRREAAY